MLTIPTSIQERITTELATIPSIVGKVHLTFEFNLGTGNVVNSLKVKRYIEDEVRSA